MHRGFTLAELLMALLILGVISTFTIPKVLTTTREMRYQGYAKEFMATMSEAYMLHKYENGISTGTSVADLTNYMNYVKVDTSTQTDKEYGLGDVDCNSGGRPCLILHNGAAARYHPGETFGGTETTRAIHVHFDPDGEANPDPTGSGKALEIYLYYNGMIRTKGTIIDQTCNSGYCDAVDPAQDPPWFSWN